MAGSLALQRTSVRRCYLRIVIGRTGTNDLKRFALHVLLVAAMAFGCGKPAEKVERSVGRDKSRTENYLKAHVLVLYAASGKALFVTDGKLGVYDSGHNWRNEFTLATGERFQAQPDHHASSNFEIKDVNPSGVVLKYSNRFDHGSFGKDLITIDEGEIQLTFKREK
jgi:hypothetical protein